MNVYKKIDDRWTAREMLTWIQSLDPDLDELSHTPVLVKDSEFGSHVCSCLPMVLGFYENLIMRESGIADMYDDIPEDKLPWTFTVKKNNGQVLISRYVRRV